MQNVSVRSDISVLAARHVLYNDEEYLKYVKCTSAGGIPPNPKKHEKHNPFLAIRRFPYDSGGFHAGLYRVLPRPDSNVPFGPPLARGRRGSCV